MRRLRLGIILSFVFFSLCARAQVTQVDVTGFDQRLEHSQLQLLDVRTAEEFNQGHLKDAMLADWKEQAEFQRRAAALEKDTPVLVYCLSGGRSAQAAAYLQEQGFEVIELKGGINAWTQAGKPVEGVDPAVQISAESYAAMLQSAELVLVNFGAPWCPPCRKMEPVLQSLKVQLPDLPVIDIDAGTQSALMKEHQVQQMPTYILYEKGDERWRKSGLTELNESLQAMP